MGERGPPEQRVVGDEAFVRVPAPELHPALDEIERDFGLRPKDLHRPYVDDLTRPNPDDPTGKSMMRRTAAAAGW